MFSWLPSLSMPSLSVVFIGLISSCLGALIPVAAIVVLMGLVRAVGMSHQEPWTPESLAKVQTAVDQAQQDLRAVAASIEQAPDRQQEPLAPELEQRAAEASQKLRTALFSIQTPAKVMTRSNVLMPIFLLVYGAAFFAVGALVALSTMSAR